MRRIFKPSPPKFSMEIVEFATNKDIEEIAKVYLGWLDYQSILPNKLIEPETSEDLEKQFKNNSTRKYVVARLNNKIVGVCYVDTSFSSLNSIRLGDMFVDKNHRGSGVASSLINFIIKYAKENNIRKIWLWTQEELIPAIKLYEKHGFVLEGKQKSQFCNKDALLYGLVLN